MSLPGPVVVDLATTRTGKDQPPMQLLSVRRQAEDIGAGSGKVPAAQLYVLGAGTAGQAAL